MKRALILVDIQNDFLPGGALAVPNGDEIIPIVNGIMRDFDLVVATQDFHPESHGSFSANHSGANAYEVVDLNGLDQVLWPTHCVAGSYGAEFASELDMSMVAQVFPKGMEQGIDSYSGFFDNGRRKDTGLGNYLKAMGIEEVFVVGLATDYCVKYTAIDAVSLGFRTHVLKDATRGVNVAAGDSERAIEEMKEVGVSVILSTEILAPVSIS